MLRSGFVTTCLTALALAGCANAPLPSLTTGSLFGSKPDTQAAATPGAASPAAIKNDPTARALYVSRVAAKAQRCGFYFDSVKLKGNFMAAEGAQGGTDVAELGRLDQVYNASFNGTTKAVTANEAYCSAERTAHVKADLARHLAGDFAPGQPYKDAAADEGGLLSGGGLFGGSGGDKSPGSNLPTNNL